MHTQPQIVSLVNVRHPQVGDEIVYTGANPAQYPGRRFLNAKIGPDDNNPGSELWFAWIDQGGTLDVVSVGKYWILKRLDTE